MKLPTMITVGHEDRVVGELRDDRRDQPGDEPPASSSFQSRVGRWTKSFPGLAGSSMLAAGIGFRDRTRGRRRACGVVPIRSMS